MTQVFEYFQYLSNNFIEIKIKYLSKDFKIPEYKPFEISGNTTVNVAVLPEHFLMINTK